MPNAEESWGATREAELTREYARIGYIAGEPWPAPPDGLSPDSILELLRRVPDGTGRTGYMKALAELAARGEKSKRCREK